MSPVATSGALMGSAHADPYRLRARVRWRSEPVHGVVTPLWGNPRPYVSASRIDGGGSGMGPRPPLPSRHILEVLAEPDSIELIGTTESGTSDP